MDGYELYDVVLTFTEPLLGTAPLNPEFYCEWVGSKNPNGLAEDEAESMEWCKAEEIEKGTTGFHRAGDKPILYDYQIKGFFKDACGMLRRVKGTSSSNLTAHKKVIDGLVFIKPRRIAIELAGDIGILERPLRAQTAQGERVALARSEYAPAGSKIRFSLLVLGSKDVKESLLREWLEYGALRGLGQWRNAGYGAFEYTLTKHEAAEQAA
jgi:hypothetical protein